MSDRESTNRRGDGDDTNQMSDGESTNERSDGEYIHERSNGIMGLIGVVPENGGTNPPYGVATVGRID